jgi:hypothetical protein
MCAAPSEIASDFTLTQLLVFRYQVCGKVLDQIRDQTSVYATSMKTLLSTRIPELLALIVQHEPHPVLNTTLVCFAFVGFLWVSDLRSEIAVRSALDPGRHDAVCRSRLQPLSVLTCGGLR